MSTIYINTDGGSRGNPGPAGIGVVFYDKNEEEIHACHEFIGEATNNQSEYKAIILALEVLTKSKWMEKNNGDQEKKVICRLDSKLVVEQINGNFKVKNEGIKPLISKVNKIKAKIEVPIDFIHVPREKNARADELANIAMDEGAK